MLLDIFWQYEINIRYQSEIYSLTKNPFTTVYTRERWAKRRRPSETVEFAGPLPPRMARCTEPDCEEPAAVRLHVPWAEDRVVCAAHARALSTRDGIVAEPLADADEEFP